MYPSKYTRIPVWEDEPDNVVGILHAKNLLIALRSHDGDAESIDMKQILTQPWFTPDKTTLREQLRAFREKKNHFALVVDEYGALLGIVTLEDILEEIVGNIEDEHDIEAKKIKKQGIDSYVVEGTVTIRDINRELEWSLPDEDASTIAGLIMFESQQIPSVGQKFHFHGCRFEILKRHRNQITSIRMTKNKDTETEIKPEKE